MTTPHSLSPASASPTAQGTLVPHTVLRRPDLPARRDHGRRCGLLRAHRPTSAHGKEEATLADSHEPHFQGRVSAITAPPPHRRDHRPRRPSRPQRRCHPPRRRRGSIGFTASEYGPASHLVSNAGPMLFLQVVRPCSRRLGQDDRHQPPWLPARRQRRPARNDRPPVGPHRQPQRGAGIRVGDVGGVHSATRFFIRDMTESLRQEVGTVHGIRVSLISPGVNDTGWADGVCNAEGDKKPRAAAGAIRPDRVADAVLRPRPAHRRHRQRPRHPPHPPGLIPPPPAPWSAIGSTGQQPAHEKEHLS